MASTLLTAQKAITAHAWNADLSAVAICPNSNAVEIYTKKGTKFEKTVTLEEHTQVVTSLHWGKENNKLLSCSQDRNAYVWTVQEDGSWKPELVLLRISRGAVAIQWCPNESKFAVASSAKSVSVCYYSAENDWWPSKHIKKGITSTCLSIDWHPNNYLVAAGSSDYKARIFCAAIKGVDKKPAPSNWAPDAKLSFGEPLMEFDFGTSWVHDVSFSPSGNKLAFVSHDSCLTIVCSADSGGPDNRAVVKTTDLPNRSVQFLTENTLVAAGYDCNPSVYSGDDSNNWTFMARLDKAEKKAAASKTGTAAAFSKFAKADKLNSTDEKNKTELNTQHQNAISAICLMDENQISTSGLDGKIIVWKLRDLEKDIGDLKIA